MKKILAISLAVALLIGVVAYSVSAEEVQMPSAKSAFAFDQVMNITITDTYDDTPEVPSERSYAPILDTWIKTGGPKDLVIDVSAQCAIVTDTYIKGKASSTADAQIMVRVKVDDEYASPGGEAGIVFENRIQTLTGDLKHYITYHDWGDFPGYIVIEDHELELFLSTCSANAFNFVKEDVGSGPHHVVVEAALRTTKEGNIFEDETNDWDAGVEAYIGNVSVIVDEANLKYPKNTE